MNRAARHSQAGTVLLISLILLMVITTLAISSLRDSTLEVRVMTNDLEQRRLLNAAEAGLREAERKIAEATTPLTACGTPPCLQGMATNATVDFSAATPYPTTTQPNATVRWYIRQIPVAGRQPDDASYGAAARDGGTYYYEVSSQAVSKTAKDIPRLSPCTDGAVCVRSVMARTFVQP